MNKKIAVSPSLEDYLETMFFLLERNKRIRVTDVAIELNISKPSVNKAINILKTQGLVEHEVYKNLTLTEKGEMIAKSVAKKHFILKRFLKDFLHIEDNEAEEEACRIEHQMSIETVNKLEIFLNEISSIQ